MEKFKKLFWQFFKFGIVGFSSTIVNAGVYMVVIATSAFLIGVGKDQLAWYWPVIANVFGFFIATYNGYFWQTKYVFKGERSFNRMVRVYIAYIPGLVLSTTLIWLLTEIIPIPISWANFLNAEVVNGVAHMPKFWAQLPTLFVTVPTNFVVQKFWAYQEGKDSE